jgi:nitroreductase
MTSQGPEDAPAPLEMTPDELLTTTRSVRRRLDLERPVERSVVETCLDLALQAPNGSNLQRWQWLVVDDRAAIGKVAELYNEALASYAAEVNRGEIPGYEPQSVPGMDRITESVMHLAQHLHRVPVLIVPCFAGRMEGVGVFEQASLWGSILPAVWSLMLALRSRGLGSAWTTVHLHREREVARVLDIPFERYTQAGLFPVAWTLGTRFRRAPRKPLASVLHWNCW